MEILRRHLDWDKVQYICNRLHENGYKAYLAGGSVRDALMGKEAKDFDIATDADPEVVSRLFAKTLEVGKNFGTTVVVLEGSNFEVTRFRKDGHYKDGRRPESIKFSTAEEDAKRRDFTVNALFYDTQSDLVLDYVGGQEDIKLRNLRFVGDAFDRIQEDKLRIMRGIRFVGQLGFELDLDAYNAIRAYAYALPQVSQERITEEFKKIIDTKYFLKALRDFEAAGVFEVAYPELFNIWEKAVAGGYETEYNDPWILCKQMLYAYRKEKDLGFKLACFFAPFAFWTKYMKLVQNWQSYLMSKKFSKKEANDISSYQRHINKLVKPRDLSYLKKMMSEAGSQYTRKTLIYHKDLFPFATENLDNINSFLFAQASYSLPKPLVTGRDLMRLGFQAGKELGGILDLVFEEQLNDNIHSKEEAISFLVAHLQKLEAERNSEESDDEIS